MRVFDGGLLGGAQLLHQVIAFSLRQHRTALKKEHSRETSSGIGTEVIERSNSDKLRELQSMRRRKMLLFCAPYAKSEWTSSKNLTCRSCAASNRRSCHNWHVAMAEQSPKTTRRVAIQSFAAAAILLAANPAFSRIEGPELRGLDQATGDQPPFTDVGEGVNAQEVSSGSGDAQVEDGSLVGVKYVMRRSNGYFIDASYGFDRFETFNFRAGSGQVVPGFDIALRGMHVGARRRFVIPPRLGYVKGTGKNDPGPIPPDFGARRSLASHAKEPLIFEVQVVKIRP